MRKIQRTQQTKGDVLSTSEYLVFTDELLVLSCVVRSFAPVAPVDPECVNYKRLQIGNISQNS